MFNKPLLGSIATVLISTACAALAGLIIGALFMSFVTFPAILAFAGLHAIGGLIGGLVGAGIITTLKARRIEPGAVRG
jgi:membrane associated rhomboid family serine protease